MNKIEVEKKIEKALSEIRPYLQSDGGDVSFVELNDNYEVTVKLIGACGTCPMRMQTFKTGIERSIKNKIPQVSRIIAIDENMNDILSEVEN